jgi:hypothetical protein
MLYHVVAMRQYVYVLFVLHLQAFHDYVKRRNRMERCEIGENECTAAFVVDLDWYLQFVRKRKLPLLTIV